MKLRPVVVDTNGVVAGLLTSDSGSPTAKILDGMLDGSLPFLLSTPLLAEYRRVLLRPKIRARHGLSADEIDRILTEMTAMAIVREPARGSHHAPERGDQHLWDLLAAEPRAVLVTGDRELLEESLPGALTLTPARYIAERER